MEKTYRVITGAAGSGKTAALVEACAAALERGVAPKDMLLVTATQDAALAAKERLEGVAVMPALEWCAAVAAASPKLDETTRVLAPAEVLTLAADLGAFGARPWAMRSIRAYGEGMNVCLGDWKAVAANLPAGLGAVDEAAWSRFVVDLRDALKSWGALLPAEVAPVARRVMVNNPNARPAFKKKIILLDDAQLLNRCVLDIAALLATEELIVAADPAQCYAAVLPYPEAEAFAAVPEGFVAAETVSLAKATGSIAAFVAAGTGREDVGAADAAVAFPAPGAHVLKWNDPGEEFLGLARMVQLYIQKNDLKAGDMTLVVPNAAWGRNLSRTIYERKLETLVTVGAPFTADPRNPKSQDLGTFELLAWTASGNATAAIRTWCGLGTPDLGAAAWKALEDYAAAHGSDAIAELESLTHSTTNPEVFPGAQALTKKYAQGKAQVQLLGQLRGLSLANRLANGAEPLALQPVLGNIDDLDTAADVWARAKNRVFDPTFEADLGRVRICTANRLAGTAPELLIIAGAANGFFPGTATAANPADAAKAQAAFFAACGKAAKHLVISYPQTMEAETAKKFGIPVLRTKVVDGTAMATLKATPYLAQAGNAAPVTQSGDQALSLLQ